ncbi:glutamine amidotransferase [Pseudokineococcus basanitobsidens]|uniref:Lipid II isoglutaminyl synthase (glutamine-hydrolyzing) subunit GatD n=1 Tax=Pseudokineococcus basanitobsidens TaxID=1926649 RepID=A0ABU8RMQ3_9ACTN
MSGPSAVRIAVLYPELLGTYGDGGNAAVLRARAQARGLEAEVVEVVGSEALPRCDVYLLGGGEDGPQRHVARLLAQEDRMARAVAAGGSVLAVCAGMQILGSAFRDVDGSVPGLSLLPCRTVEPLPAERRAVGEVVAEADPRLDLPRLVGFENHGGRTALDDGAVPLGRVLRGTGNGVGQDAVDGVVAGRVVGTYLHGPVLALNPALADRLLGWAVGDLPEGDERLVRLDEAAEQARAVRLRMAGLAAA